MPLYDFVCNDCGKSFELALSLAEREGESPKKMCAHCSSTSVKQLITFGSGGLRLGGTISIKDLKRIPPSEIERA